MVVDGAGMAVTPGGRDESLVPEGQRLGREAEIEERIGLLVASTTFTIFSYVAQVGNKLWESKEERACR
jgi:hypothetical protein